MEERKSQSVKESRPIKELQPSQESILRVSPAVTSVSPALHQATSTPNPRMTDQKSSSPYANKTNHYNHLATEEAQTNTSDKNTGIVYGNIINSLNGYSHHWPYNNQNQLQNPNQNVTKSYHPYSQNQPSPRCPQNIGEAEYQIHQSALTKTLSSVDPASLNLLKRMWREQRFHEQPSYKGPTWIDQTGNCQGPSGPPRPNLPFQEFKSIHDPSKGQPWPIQDPYLRPGTPHDPSKGPNDIYSAQIQPQDLSKGPPRLVSSANNHPGQLRPYR